MKKIFMLLLITLSCGSSSVFSQEVKEDKVPANVKAEFKKQFPEITKVEWKLKTDKNYEAEFTLKGSEIAAKFDPVSGKLLETESEIKESTLPSAVKDAIAKEYPGYKNIEIQTVETPDGKEKLYEIHLKKGNEIVRLQLSADGKTLDKKVKMEEESKEKK